MTHEELLKECIAAFEEYVAAVDAARRWYSDSNLWRLDGLDARIDEAELRFYDVKDKLQALAQ
jgi:hypothetical protein